MEYKDLFDTVRRRLDSLGVKYEIEAGKLASEKVLEKIEAKIQVQLPSKLRAFYQTVGDGFSFSWQSDADDLEQPFANLQIPTLKHLASLYSGWREMVLYSPEEAEKYGFPYTKDPALAKRTAARMWNWLPVIEEGNGDMFCLELNGDNCPVIFNKHDWLDGGTGDNGHPMASNWEKFLSDWASVCFQFPKSMYWPTCFRDHEGIDWNGDEFRDPYRIQ